MSNQQLQNKVTDTRYTLTLENCGYEFPRHVIRFCGEWVSQHESVHEALQRAQIHQSNRQAAL